MSFQAYLDNIYAKTGKTADDFKAMAKEKGISTHAEIMAWLKADYDLGFGHARAIVHVIQSADEPDLPIEDHVAKHFTGDKARWRTAYDKLIERISAFGQDVSAGPGATYINLLRGGKKFGIVQVMANRLDVGIKLKGVPAEGRYEAAGSWNAMVTHRVRIDDASQIDDELITWLHQAYDKAA